MNGYGASWWSHTLRIVDGRLVVLLPVGRIK
jgi:hypothetical protein